MDINKMDVLWNIPLNRTIIALVLFSKSNIALVLHQFSQWKTLWANLSVYN